VGDHGPADSRRGPYQFQCVSLKHLDPDDQQCGLGGTGCALEEDQPVCGTIGDHNYLSGRNCQLIRVKYKYMTKIVSFGDSFLLGNELHQEDGTATWPGLISNDLEVEYETRAEAGCGNEQIARQIYTYFSANNTQNVLAVINWTWCMRWDFYLQESNCWVTLGPTCVPSKLENQIGLDKANELINFYQNYTGHSDVWNRFRSLQTIYSVQSWLRDHKISSVQTYMDPSMLETSGGNRMDHYNLYRDPSWPDITFEQDLENLPIQIKQELEKDYAQYAMPDYITCLQSLIRPHLETFENLTFLEWSRFHQYPITELLHPLEPAHQAAADFWRDRYVSLLGVKNHGQ